MFRRPSRGRHGTAGIISAGPEKMPIRWDIFGNPADFRSGKVSIPTAALKDCNTQLPFDAGSTTIGSVRSPDVVCAITSVYGTTPLAASATSSAICRCVGPLPFRGTAGVNWLLRVHKCNSFVVAPALGTYGNMGRISSVTRDWRTVDLSIFKNFKFKERYGARSDSRPLISPITHRRQPVWRIELRQFWKWLPGGWHTRICWLDARLGCGEPAIGSGASAVMQLD